MRVAEQHGARSEQVVEIAAPGDVVELRAPALANDELETRTRAVAAEETTGKDTRSTLEKIVLITH
jgi:hypothetical protein